MRECKVAFIGAGNIAREHLKAFSDMPNIVLSGICSRTVEKANKLAQEFGIGHVYGAIGELYDNTRADLVVVTVSAESMKAVAMACIEHRWTILLEKPPGINVEEAEVIWNAAAGRNHCVLVALNRRFMSSIQTLTDDLARDLQVRFIYVQDQQDRDAAYDYGHSATVVNHLMYANSIHVVDLLVLLGRGHITDVHTIIPWKNGESNVVVASVEFSSGDIAIYQGVWEMPGPWALSITTPRRRWELRPLETAAYQDSGERQLHPVELHEWDRLFKPGFRLQAQEAVKSSIGEPSQSTTLQDCIMTMKLIEKIYGN